MFLPGFRTGPLIHTNSEVCICRRLGKPTSFWGRQKQYWQLLARDVVVAELWCSDRLMVLKEVVKLNDLNPCNNFS